MTVNIQPQNSNFKIVNKRQRANNKSHIIWQLIFVLFLEVGCWKFGFSAAFASQVVSSIDFEDTPVISVVQTLAKSAGFDLVLSGDQSVAQAKKATIHLSNITLEAAIEYILRTNGFNYEKKDNVLLVSSLPQDQMQTAYKQEVAVQQLKYLSAGKAADLLAKLMPTASCQVGGQSNTLVVRARGEELNDIKQLLAAIDKKAPQILIESKVIELSQSNSLQLGVSYGNGTLKLVTNKDTKKTSLAENIMTTVNALIADGKANVIASPKIATLDNQEALINIGNRIPYAVPVTSSGATTQWTVDYIDAGVKLKITPQLGQDGDITTLIQPEVSSISEWRTTAAGDFPVISTRNASATVRVKDGETIAIGGLLSETERENITRVPVLGYIPVLGLLFQNKNLEKEKTEIVFLITPHII